MARKKKGGRAAVAGVAALAAAGAAAGYYFYVSQDAKKNRRVAAKWATDLKDDVVRETKRVQDMDRKDIARIVDKAVAAYASVRSIDPKEVKRAASELKSNWESVLAEARGAGRKRRAAKTSARGAKKRR